MSTLPEPLCRKAGSGSASRFWEKSSSRAKVITGCTTDFTFHHCPAHCWKMALEQKFRKRHQHKWGHCSHPGTRGSHGHRSGDTECLSLLTSVSGCHLSEAFCCFSFAHTANTKLNRIYATSFKTLVFNPVKNIHMSFFPSLLLKYPHFSSPGMYLTFITKLSFHCMVTERHWTAANKTLNGLLRMGPETKV